MFRFDCDSYCSFRQCVSRQSGFALLIDSRNGSHPTHLDCVGERENASDFFCGCQVESANGRNPSVSGSLAWERGHPGRILSGLEARAPEDRARD